MMDHLKQRIALLQEDLARLVKEAKAKPESLTSTDLKSLLRVSRELESFSIGQLAISAAGSKTRR